MIARAKNSFILLNVGFTWSTWKDADMILITIDKLMPIFILNQIRFSNKKYPQIQFYIVCMILLTTAIKVRCCICVLVIWIPFHVRHFYLLFLSHKVTLLFSSTTILMHTHTQSKELILKQSIFLYEKCFWKLLDKRPQTPNAKSSCTLTGLPVLIWCSFQLHGYWSSSENLSGHNRSSIEC